MILDIILAIIIFVWAVFGYRRGFVRQLFTLAGILLVVFVSAPMADMLEKILTRELDVHMDGRYMRGFLLSASGAVLYLLSHIAGRFMHDTLVKGISLAEKTNHVLGMTLALVQAGLVIYFILCIGSVYQNKVQEYAPNIYQNMTSSIGYTIADNANLLENYTFFQKDEMLENEKLKEDSKNKKENNILKQPETQIDKQSNIQNKDKTSEGSSKSDKSTKEPLNLEQNNQVPQTRQLRRKPAES